MFDIKQELTALLKQCEIDHTHTIMLLKLLEDIPTASLQTDEAREHQLEKTIRCFQSLFDVIETHLTQHHQPPQSREAQIIWHNKILCAYFTLHSDFQTRIAEYIDNPKLRVLVQRATQALYPFKKGIRIHADKISKLQLDCFKDTGRWDEIPFTEAITIAQQVSFVPEDNIKALYKVASHPNMPAVQIMKTLIETYAQCNPMNPEVTDGGYRGAAPRQVTENFIQLITTHFPSVQMLLDLEQVFMSSRITEILAAFNTIYDDHERLYNLLPLKPQKNHHTGDMAVYRTNKRAYITSLKTLGFHTYNAKIIEEKYRRNRELLEAFTLPLSLLKHTTEAYLLVEALSQLTQAKEEAWDLNKIKMTIANLESLSLNTTSHSDLIVRIHTFCQLCLQITAYQEKDGQSQWLKEHLSGFGYDILGPLYARVQTYHQMDLMSFFLHPTPDDEQTLMNTLNQLPSFQLFVKSGFIPLQSDSITPDTKKFIDTAKYLQKTMTLFIETLNNQRRRSKPESPISREISSPSTSQTSQYLSKRFVCKHKEPCKLLQIMVIKNQKPETFLSAAVTFSAPLQEDTQLQDTLFSMPKLGAGDCLSIVTNLFSPTTRAVIQRAPQEINSLIEYFSTTLYLTVIERHRDALEKPQKHKQAIQWYEDALAICHFKTPTPTTTQKDVFSVLLDTTVTTHRRVPKMKPTPPLSPKRYRRAMSPQKRLQPQPFNHSLCAPAHTNTDTPDEGPQLRRASAGGTSPLAQRKKPRAEAASAPAKPPRRASIKQPHNGNKNPLSSVNRHSLQRSNTTGSTSSLTSCPPIPEGLGSPPGAPSFGSPFKNGGLLQQRRRAQTTSEGLQRTGSGRKRWDPPSSSELTTKILAASTDPDSTEPSLRFPDLA